MLYSIEDRKVEVRGQDYFVADNASVIGSVVIEDNVNIWFNTVIRGDIGIITIGEGTNIQDGCIMHTDGDGEVSVGRYVSVGHMALLHNCTIGDNTLIGMNAVILSDARIGKNCIIGANSLVTGGKEIPDNSLVMGSPAKVVRSVTEPEIKMIKDICERYIENFKRYKNGLKVQE